MIINKLILIAKCVLINENNKILILKRTNYKKNNSEGLWDLPGGSVELGENINDAIKRECQEELQVELLDVKIFDVDSGLINKGGENIEDIMYICNLFFSKNYKTNQGIKLSEEHSEYKWIPVSEIDKYDFYGHENRIKAIKKFFFDD